MTTTAKILAKGTKGTGLEEPLAKKLYDQLGSKVLVIAELVSEKRGDDRSGNEHVDLTILSLEPVVPDAEDHVRGLQRAMFMNRRLHSTDAQPTLDSIDDVEPTVSEVLEKGRQFTPHDFERDKAVTDDVICAVCGGVEDHDLHAPAELSTYGGPFDSHEWMGDEDDDDHTAAELEGADA